GQRAGGRRLYRARRAEPSEPLWAFPQPELTPYDLECADLIEAIQDDKPFNETRRGAEASLVTSMGRMSAHTGRIISYHEILNCDHEFAPMVGEFTMDSPPPLQAGPDGKYPVPMPGIVTEREY